MRPPFLVWRALKVFVVITARNYAVDSLNFPPAKGARRHPAPLRKVPVLSGQAGMILVVVGIHGKPFEVLPAQRNSSKWHPATISCQVSFN